MKVKRRLGCIGLLLVVAGCRSPDPDLPDTELAGDSLAARWHARNLYHEGRAMVLSPAISRHYSDGNRGHFWPITTRKAAGAWGILRSDQRLVGLDVVQDRGRPVAVFGCAVCHTGKAAGQVIPGLGNKNFDLGAAGRDFGFYLLLEQLPWRRPQTGADQELLRNAEAFARVLGDERFANTTQGLVPTGLTFRTFFNRRGVEAPASLQAGAVKTPHLWGYAAKQEAGFFCDGIGDGRSLGWLAAVPFAAGQLPEGIRARLPEIRKINTLLEEFQPPPYPFAIDSGASRRGFHVFEKTCAGCHGEHRTPGGPALEPRPPRWIPLEAVGTDPERTRMITPDLLEAIAASELSSLLQTRPRGEGYLAPRLEGIWSRFPYLHNGSIPNLATLLAAPSQRHGVFNLNRAGERERFDPDAVGLTVPPAGSPEEAWLGLRAAAGARGIYSTRRPGGSNRGHPFGTHLPPDAKRDLLEYLKSL